VPTLTVVVVMAGLAAIAMAVFGLPPVDVHGPWHYLGVMDPLCGMTRAVRLLAQAHMARAVEYNPASPLLAVFGAVVLVRAAVGRSTGRWLELRFRWSATAYAALAVLVGLLWAHQQLHAGLLMRT
jgi:hypothetical protein